LSGQTIDLATFHSPHWEDYALLDSGDGRKLERFGPYALIRPEPLATWELALSQGAWAAADAILHLGGRTEGGRWELRRSIERSWTMRYKYLMFRVGINRSRHIGLFPEHAAHWDWIETQVATSTKVERDPIRVLTLFCYTGLATLAAAAAGAVVTHVDASRRAVTIGRQNQGLSDLQDRPIRWIVDDALKFVRREARRGVRYEGIVMDPPRFGRGPRGEVWEFFESFPLLCEACRDVLSERPSFVLLTAYAKRASAPELYKAIEELMHGFGGSMVAGELVTIEQSAGRVIPHSLSVRWSADR
jgi:23S rRNA (cytosine1962-C5)-methyltransferase